MPETWGWCLWEHSQGAEKKCAKVCVAEIIAGKLYPFWQL